MATSIRPFLDLNHSKLMSDPVQQRPWRSRVLTRLFHLYFRLQRPMTLGVRALAFDGEGRIFLVRHSYVPGWHLPGGGVEPGETALACLEREIDEEGHLRATVPPRLFGFYFNNRISRRDHVALYVLQNVVQTAPRAPDREIVEAGFFSPDDLPDGVTAATRRRIAEVLEGRMPDPLW